MAKKQTGAPPQKNKKNTFTKVNFPVTFEQNELLKEESIRLFGSQNKVKVIGHYLKPLFDKISNK